MAILVRQNGDQVSVPYKTCVPKHGYDMDVENRFRIEQVGGECWQVVEVVKKGSQQSCENFVRSKLCKIRAMRAKRRNRKTACGA